MKFNLMIFVVFVCLMSIKLYSHPTSQPAAAPGCHLAIYGVSNIECCQLSDKDPSCLKLMLAVWQYCQLS